MAKYMYIKDHPYCIEERAKAYYGTTEIPEFAGYLLEDGTMLNFSYEGYQRDMDHREIGQFFSKAQSTEAMIKFMRRGNIRCMNNNSGYRFEFIREPTQKQMQVLQKAYHTASRNAIEYILEKDDLHGRAEKVYYNPEDYVFEKLEKIS